MGSSFVSRQSHHIAKRGDIRKKQLSSGLVERETMSRGRIPHCFLGFWSPNKKGSFYFPYVGYEKTC